MISSEFLTAKNEPDLLVAGLALKALVNCMSHLEVRPKTKLRLEDFAANVARNIFVHFGMAESSVWGRF